VHHNKIGNQRRGLINDVLDLLEVLALRRLLFQHATAGRV